jgi:hypothetical protein
MNQQEINARMVRGYDKGTLEFMLTRLQKGLRCPFTNPEIEAELKRRVLNAVKY